MKKFFASVGVMFAALIIALTSAAQQAGVALVIGNDAYDASPLKNPANDTKERIAFWSATPTPEPTSMPTATPAVEPLPTQTPELDAHIEENINLFREAITLIQENYPDETKIKTPDLMVAAINAIADALRNQGMSSEEIEKICKISQTAENIKAVENILHSAPSSRLTSQELVYAAITGILKSLDEHSSFMPPQRYQELPIETRGGIGIEIGIKEGQLMVIAPFDDTPAFRIGIRAGDNILKINETQTDGLSLMEAVKLLRGAQGTTVALTIMRDSFERPKEFMITRERINIKNVISKMLRRDLGYVRIRLFEEDTAGDLASALKNLMQQQMKSLILDLRNNQGGLLNDCVEVAEQFLDRGKLIVYYRWTRPNQDMRFIAKSGAVKANVQYPIIVLVNHGTAGKAEILAAALQAHSRAIIIGMPTYGKGSVQSVIPLADGSRLRLTTAFYFTPDNKPIHLRGIIPNIFVIPKDDQKLVYKAQAIVAGEKYPLILAEETEEDSMLNVAVEIIENTSSYQWKNLIETAQKIADGFVNKEK